MDDPLGPSDWQFVTPQLPVPDVQGGPGLLPGRVWVSRSPGPTRKISARSINGATEVFFSQEDGEIQDGAGHFVRVGRCGRAARDLSRARGEDRRRDRVPSLGHAGVHDRGQQRPPRFRIGHSEGPVVAPGGSTVD